MSVYPASLPHVRLLIPAYNEAADLPVLLSRIDSLFRACGLPHEVLVVNDGSSDATADLVRNFTGSVPIQLLDVQPHQGLAAAMRIGLTRCASELSSHAVLVTMDADNTHPPEHIPRLLECFDTCADIAIASRYQPGAHITGMKPHRALLSWIGNRLLRLLTPMQGVRDYTCGFRAYRVGLLHKALDHYGDRLIEQDGFGVFAELLIRLRRFQPRVVEIPLQLHYEAKAGASKLRVGSTLQQTLQLLRRNYQPSDVQTNT